MLSLVLPLILLSNKAWKAWTSTGQLRYPGGVPLSFLGSTLQVLTPAVQVDVSLQPINLFLVGAGATVRGHPVAGLGALSLFCSQRHKSLPISTANWVILGLGSAKRMLATLLSNGNQGRFSPFRPVRLPSLLSCTCRHGQRFLDPSFRMLTELAVVAHPPAAVETGIL